MAFIHLIIFLIFEIEDEYNCQSGYYYCRQEKKPVFRFKRDQYNNFYQL